MIVQLDVISDVWITQSGTIDGYVFAPAQMERRFAVEILLDGAVLATKRADEFVEKLWREHRGDGCYGFSFAAPPGALVGNWDVRLANVDKTLARLTHHEPSPPPRSIGEVRWSGGLRLTGFVVANEDGEAISCVCEGHVVHQGRANGWTHVTHSEHYEAVRAFDIHLPRELADGEAKSVHVYAASGEELTGSPVELIAFPDSLRETLLRVEGTGSPDVRARVFDRLFPQSVPFDEWAAWSEAWLAGENGLSHPRVAVAIVGDEPVALARTSASLERQSVSGWVATALASEDGAGFSSQEAAAFLGGEAAHCAFVIFVRNGLELESNALARLMHALAASPPAQLGYPDLYWRIEAGLREPFAVSAFDYERALEQDYLGALFIIRRGALSECLSTTQDSSTFDVIFRVLESTDDAAADLIVHVPGPVGSVERGQGTQSLARAVASHLDRRGIAHSVELRAQGAHSRLRVRRRVGQCDTTIVLSWYGDEAALIARIERLRADRLAREAPILVVTNADTSAFPNLKTHRVEILGCGGEFNHHRLANAAVERIETEFVFLLDADVRAASSGWFEEMAGRAIEEDVAAVGAMTVARNGLVLQAGYVLGVDYAAGEAFAGARPDDPGYGDLQLVAHETAGISMRCSLVRTAMVKKVGGFDEATYPAPLRDIDLCLRLQQHRRRIVLTPHARFIDERPVLLDVPRMSEHAQRQLARFRAQWGRRLLNDPLYNPILGLDGAAYSSLAWPPRSLMPRYRFQGDRQGGD